MADKTYEVSQSFNHGKARNYATMTTDAITLSAIIALMPDGQSVFAPTATGSQGTARVRPSSYVEAQVTCFDKSEGAFKSNFVNVKLGKATLTDDDIVLACKNIIEVPGGSTADNVSIKKFKMV